MDDQLLERLRDDETAAKRYFLRMRWPNYQRACPRCGSRKFSWVRSGTRRACGGCRFEYGEFTGTWLGGSKLEFACWVKVIDGFVRGLNARGIRMRDGIRQPTVWACLRTIRLAIRTGAPRAITVNEIKLLEVGDEAARSTYTEFQKSLAKHHGVREAEWPLYFQELEFKKRTGKADMFEEVVKLLVRLKADTPEARRPKTDEDRVY